MLPIWGRGERRGSAGGCDTDAYSLSGVALRGLGGLGELDAAAPVAGRAEAPTTDSIAGAGAGAKAAATAETAAAAATKSAADSTADSAAASPAKATA